MLTASFFIGNLARNRKIVPKSAISATTSSFPHAKSTVGALERRDIFAIFLPYYRDFFKIIS